MQYNLPERMQTQLRQSHTEFNKLLAHLRNTIMYCNTNKYQEDYFNVFNSILAITDKCGK